VPRNWREFAERRIEEIRRIVGDGRAINALSGGVDSSVVTVLGHRALGRQLRNIWIDTGVMRENEGPEVVRTFAALGIPVRIVQARALFFSSLKGVTDPERKRKRFRDTFYKVLGREVRRWQAHYLLQGTIKADIIETKRGVKTQHNILQQIGIDPEKGYGFQVIEPIKTLFKHEVRTLGKYLRLPTSIYERMPFPGPGLAARIVGEVTPARTAVVRKACAIVEEECRQFRPFQAFAVLLSDRATALGPRGERVFGQIIAVRCVDSRDAMTATVTRLPWPVIERIRKRICAEVSGVTKVVLDVTPKPPSTIEYV